MKLQEFSRGSFYNPIGPQLAFVVCVVFSLLCLFFAQGAGDGVWYFYGKLFLAGRNIYSDLGLVQQPAFIVLNALGIRMFGDAFLEQKLIFVVVSIAYCFLLYRLSVKNHFRPMEAFLLVMCVYFTSIRFEAYRFDDYHVFENVLVMSIMLLCPLAIAWDGKIGFYYIAMGVLSGVAITTRVNDGVVILFAVALIISLAKKKDRLAGISVTVISAAVSVISIIYFCGETVSSWLHSTILSAAAAKGGGGAALLAPLYLLKNSIVYLYSEQSFELWRFVVLAALMAVLISVKFSRMVFYSVLAKIVICIFVGVLLYTYRKLDITPFYTAIAYVSGFAICIIGGLRIVRQKWLGNLDTFSVDRLVVLFPMALFSSGAMSSGGYHFGLYFPLALFILLMSNRFLKIPAVPTLPDTIGRNLFVILMLNLACTNAIYKIKVPYAWHSYAAAPLYEKRILVDSAKLGVFVTSREMYEFVQPVCDAIGGGEVLSLPFPFVNYYCGVPVWHDYVQTFFDTTTKATIDGLIADVKIRPPKYVFYQRQLDNLRLHEIVFNLGNPLPHRILDEFIMLKIESGKWSVISERKDGGNDWLLISTQE